MQINIHISDYFLRALEWNYGINDYTHKKVFFKVFIFIQHWLYTLHYSKYLRCAKSFYPCSTKGDDGCFPHVSEEEITPQKN